MFMLNTNIVSAIIRNSTGVASKRSLLESRRTLVCVSVIVAAEMRFGAAKRDAPRLSALIEEFLTEIHVMSWEQPADRHHGSIRAMLESSGHSIGANDLFIAAHAMALNATLVTANTESFSRVPGLHQENWLIVSAPSGTPARPLL